MRNPQQCFPVHLVGKNSLNGRQWWECTSQFSLSGSCVCRQRSWLSGAAPSGCKWFTLSISQAPLPTQRPLLGSHCPGVPGCLAKNFSEVQQTLKFSLLPFSSPGGPDQHHSPKTAFCPPVLSLHFTEWISSKSNLILASASQGWIHYTKTLNHMTKREKMNAILFLQRKRKMIFMGHLLMVRYC